MKYGDTTDRGIERRTAPNRKEANSMKLFSILTRKPRRIIVVAAATLIAVGTATSPAWAIPNPDPDDPSKIAFCHATGSSTNPYVAIETSVAAFFQAGHIDHQEDIWPAFTYTKQGVNYTVPAQNWNAEGQAILRNGCKVVPIPTPSPTPTETVTPTPTPTETTASPTPTPTPTGTTASPTPTPTETTTTPAPTASQTTTATPTVTSTLVAPKPKASTAAAAVPEQMSVSAQTSAADSGPDYTVSNVLVGSGLLLFASVLVPKLTRKRKGSHL